MDGDKVLKGFDWAKVVENYTKRGYYGEEQVKVFTDKGKISPSDHKKITDKDYIPS